VDTDNRKEKEREELARGLQKLKEVDPNFSKVLFLDFARLLFTRYIKAQGKENTGPEALEPFLSKWAYEELCQKRKNDGAIGIRKINNLIIGKLEIKHIDESSEWMQISVHFFCNYDQYTADKPNGQTIISDYTVYFNRKKTVLSPGPELMRSLHCPACGSPLADDIQGACASCGTTAAPGTDQWQIRHLTCDSMADEPIAEHTPDAKAFSGIEISVPLEAPALSADNGVFAKSPPPGIKDPMLGANLRELKARDEDFSVEDFKDTVYDLFFRLQKAWSGPDFEESRSIQTESLYLTNFFWIDSYRKKGQKNILGDPEILGTAIVSIDCDAYYDSIKVFINASGKDYTIDQRGTIVSGDPNRSSQFSELWTFIRSVPQSDTSSAMSSCPNCGGHLDNASSAECPFCGSILRGSKFPWIRAFIEQLD
jgi:predicted lipid-binding transport protein (Tim44 family)